MENDSKWRNTSQLKKSHPKAAFLFTYLIHPTISIHQLMQPPRPGRQHMQMTLHRFGKRIEQRPAIAIFKRSMLWPPPFLQNARHLLGHQVAQQVQQAAEDKPPRWPPCSTHTTLQPIHHRRHTSLGCSYSPRCRLWWVMVFKVRTGLLWTAKAPTILNTTRWVLEEKLRFQLSRK